MREFLLVLVLFLSVVNLHSQELNAQVTINSNKVQSTNKQVYTTLQKAISEFINQTKWTAKNVKPQEKINCAFTIIINSQSGNNFDASIQIQSTRPVFGSSYKTPVLNINDGSFNFTYNEFDPLIYNPITFESNLISTLVFYVYTIIGVDADTFALKGGQTYLKEAEKVMLQAQQSGIASWQNNIGDNNRFALIDNLLAPKFNSLRTIYYNYHRKGFDNFSKNENKAKQEIEKNITQLDKLHNITIGNYMIRIFLDAKNNEIVNVFSDGKKTKNQQRMVQVLQKIAPTQSSKWRKIE